MCDKTLLMFKACSSVAELAKKSSGYMFSLGLSN